MGRTFNAVMATGLALSGAAACGGETQKNLPGHIVGFSSSIDAAFYGDRWIEHYNEETFPPRPLQYVSEGIKKFKGCREVGDSVFGFNNDDSECWSDLSCSSGDDTHCEAQYAKTYNFQALENVKVLDCKAFLKLHEIKPEKPETDEACIGRAGLGLRREDTPHHVLWVDVPNPKYDKNKKGSQPLEFFGTIEVSEAEWKAATRQTLVTVAIKNSEITAHKLG